MTNLINALLITAIGMGLVFLSLLVLWGLMALTIRIFPERAAAEEEEGAVETQEESAPGEAPVAIADAAVMPSRKRRAAAIAAALALQLAAGPATAKSSEALQPPPVSAWQSVMRSNMLNKRGLKR